MKEQKVIRGQNTANAKRDASESVMASKLAAFISAFGKKYSATRFKRLSASPVKLIAVWNLHTHHRERERERGEKHRRLELSGQCIASSLLLNKRKYA